MEKFDRPAFWAEKKVLLTGHSGFKGKWLSRMLKHLGANVTGVSRDPLGDFSYGHQSICVPKIGWVDWELIGDLTDPKLLDLLPENYIPQIIIHLAAQPIVSIGFDKPLQTFQDNIMTTLNVLEFARKSKKVESVLIITSDKVYENTSSMWAFREIDSLGGSDPYSSSKAIVELLCKSYTESFFRQSGILLATARAGNVIGGGDFGPNRLIPDLIRAWLQKSVLHVRNPEYTRPWQYVLEPLNGYLVLIEKMYTSKSIDCAYNFGPIESNNISVRNLLNHFEGYFDVKVHENKELKSVFKEAAALRLDTSKALFHLGFKGKIDLSVAAQRTALIYREIISNGLVPEIFDDEVARYLSGEF